MRFAEDIWGKGIRESFASVLKKKMAGNHGRGRGTRPHCHQEEEWGFNGGGPWYGPPPPSQPNFFNQMPMNNFYSHPPQQLPQGQGQMHPFFPPQGHSDFHMQNQIRPRPRNFSQNQRPRPQFRGKLEQKGARQVGKEVLKGESSSEKGCRIPCYNCGEVGHFSSDCKKPRLYFICHTTAHLGKECPDWKKPTQAALYLGSANQGLGFFHIDTSESDWRFKHALSFDNCGVLIVEEGEVTKEEIVENLKLLFDKDWPWELREMDEYKYLVRFPPHKKISSILIHKLTYFTLEKEGVLMSLKEWTGEVEPYAVLEEVWVQVKGVPPKWIDWLTLRQLGSTLGKLTDVDWNSLLTSYGEMMRIKVKCKNPTRIPSKRVFELEDKLYLIHLKPENVALNSGGKGDDDDEEGGGGDDPAFEDMEEEQGDSGGAKSPTTDKKGKGKGDDSSHGTKDNLRDKGGKTIQLWTSLFKDNVLEEAGIAGEYSCRNLLREMELESSDGEEENQDHVMCSEDLEMVALPA